MTPEDILNEEFPEQAMEDLHRSFDGLPHGTHALWGLSYWLKDRGDQTGARMLADWAQEFAEHEANRANAAAARGGAATRVPSRHETPAPSRRAPALNLSTCSLQEFAETVTEAAQAVPEFGRYHGDAVFISAIWDQLRDQADISYQAFQRKLMQAYQDDLLELSRADLVESMPPDLVRDSELAHHGARFHFVRLDPRAAAPRARSRAAAPPRRSVDDDVLDLAVEMAGGRRKRVTLKDLRRRMGGSREQQDAVIQRLMDDGRVVLYREDSSAAVERQGLGPSAFMISGQPRHILMVL